MATNIPIHPTRNEVLATLRALECTHRRCVKAAEVAAALKTDNRVIVGERLRELVRDGMVKKDGCTWSTIELIDGELGDDE